MSWRALQDLTWHEKSLLTNRHVFGFVTSWLRARNMWQFQRLGISELRDARLDHALWHGGHDFPTQKPSETLQRLATTCNDLQRLATTCNDLQRLERQDTVLSEKKAEFSTFLAFFLNNNTYMICTYKIYKHTYCIILLENIVRFIFVHGFV